MVKIEGLTPPSNAAVLITGSSTGIGEDAALKLVSRGVTVFAGVRKNEDGEKLKAKAKSDKLIPLIMDVADQKQVAEAVATVTQILKDQGGNLLAVINNAGYSETAPLELIPLDKVRKQFEVNVVGAIAVTQAFLPLLRAQPLPDEGMMRLTKRILFISSGAGRISFPGLGVYCASKFALEAIGDAWRKELAHWSIDVILVEPGAIDTEFRNTYVKTREENVPKQADGVDPKVLAQYQKFIEVSDSKKRGHVSLCTDAIEAALFDSAPLPRYLVGSDVQILPLATKFPDRILDRVTRGAYK
jgi:NAD(P)-dependent dehydrogenase (short-subunit alcohol dehydrogenase family)